MQRAKLTALMWDSAQQSWSGATQPERGKIPHQSEISSGMRQRGHLIEQLLSHEVEWLN
jgi:hypothetical protein